MTRKWWTERGKTDNRGKQVWMGTCKKDPHRVISWSESHDAPTCGHPECAPSSGEARIWK